MFDDVGANLFDAQLAAIYAFVVHAVTRRDPRHECTSFLHLVDTCRDNDPAVLIHPSVPL
jgi:hypothetical protein